MGGLSLQDFQHATAVRNVGFWWPSCSEEGGRRGTAAYHQFLFPNSVRWGGGINWIESNQEHYTNRCSSMWKWHQECVISILPSTTKMEVKGHQTTCQSSPGNLSKLSNWLNWVLGWLIASKKGWAQLRPMGNVERSCLPCSLAGSLAHSAKEV